MAPQGDRLRRVSHVDWTDAAVNDLREVVANAALSRELMCIAWTELREHPDRDDADEGSGLDGLLWRRGITRERRASLASDDLQIDREYQAWDFVMVYRMRNLLERRRHLLNGFVILRVVSSAQFFAEYLAGMSEPDDAELAQPRDRLVE